MLYTFGYDGVGIDGGDEIVGFKRGQDKLTFVVERNFDSLTAFLESLNGADETDLTADDAFIVTMQWRLDTNGDFYFDSVLLHFKDASAFGGGRVSSPLVTVTFDEPLGLDDLIEILGGAENVANNLTAASQHSRIWMKSCRVSLARGALVLRVLILLVLTEQASGRAKSPNPPFMRRLVSSTAMTCNQPALS